MGIFLYSLLFLSAGCLEKDPISVNQRIEKGSLGPLSGGWVCDLECSVKIFFRADQFENETVSLVFSDSQDLTNQRVIHSKAGIEGDYVTHFNLNNLDLDTTYYYQISSEENDWVTAINSFHTPPGAQEDSVFRFVVFGDLREEGNVGAPGYLDTVSEDHGFTSAGDTVNPAFFIQLGDWDHRDPGNSVRTPKTRNSVINPIQDIQAWRRMHLDVMHDLPSGRQFNEYIAPNMFLIHIWDDHDFGHNDGFGDTIFRDEAQRAFMEYFPLPPLPRNPLENEDGGLWHSLRYGQAEFFILDTRSQRQKKQEGRGEDTMLGETQIKWLLESLMESDAKWKFIVSSSPWNPGTAKQNDNWNLFPAEREYLTEQFKLIRENHRLSGGRDRFIILSGDLHSGGAVYLDDEEDLIEVSTPLTNTFGGRPTTGVKIGGDPGEWHFFNPGVTEELLAKKAFGVDEDGDYKLFKSNMGYAIIEIHHEKGQDYLVVKMINTPTYFKIDRNKPIYASDGVFPTTKESQIVYREEFTLD